MNRCQQNKINKKSSPPKMQLKNETIFDMDTRKWVQIFWSKNIKP